MLRKTQGLNYLSDSQFHGAINPGPGTYDYDPARLKASHTSYIAMKVPSKGLDKSWRFEKVKGPDMGTYFNPEASKIS